MLTQKKTWQGEKRVCNALFVPLVLSTQHNTGNYKGPPPSSQKYGHKMLIQGSYSI